ncbi:hypothetical protein VTO58DRAFT_106877 [Aureobasidium pullulans]
MCQVQPPQPIRPLDSLRELGSARDPILTLRPTPKTPRSRPTNLESLAALGALCLISARASRHRGTQTAPAAARIHSTESRSRPDLKIIAQELILLALGHRFPASYQRTVQDSTVTEAGLTLVTEWPRWIEGALVLCASAHLPAPSSVGILPGRPGFIAEEVPVGVVEGPEPGLYMELGSRVGLLSTISRTKTYAEGNVIVTWEPYVDEMSSGHTCFHLVLFTYRAIELCQPLVPWDHMTKCHVEGDLRTYIGNQEARDRLDKINSEFYLGAPYMHQKTASTCDRKEDSTQGTTVLHDLLNLIFAPETLELVHNEIEVVNLNDESDDSEGQVAPPHAGIEVITLADDSDEGEPTSPRTPHPSLAPRSDPLADTAYTSGHSRWQLAKFAEPTSSSSVVSGSRRGSVMSDVDYYGIFPGSSLFYTGTTPSPTKDEHQHVELVDEDVLGPDDPIPTPPRVLNSVTSSHLPQPCPELFGL